jgi:hypothetical protein
MAGSRLAGPADLVEWDACFLRSSSRVAARNVGHKQSALRLELLAIAVFALWNGQPLSLIGLWRAVTSMAASLTGRRPEVA